MYKKDRPIDAAVTDDSYNPFGRSGGGAPVKTISGRCIAARTIAPDIRFQKQLKKVVEQGLVRKMGRGNLHCELHILCSVIRTMMCPLLPMQ